MVVMLVLVVVWVCSVSMVVFSFCVVFDWFWGLCVLFLWGVLWMRLFLRVCLCGLGGLLVG